MTNNQKRICDAIITVINHWKETNNVDPTQSPEFMDQTIESLEFLSPKTHWELECMLDGLLFILRDSK